VGFVRALAYHEDAADPIAAATGTFMIGTKGTSVAQRANRPPRTPEDAGGGAP
jgi:hypothetical protein